MTTSKKSGNLCVNCVPKTKKDRLAVKLPEKKGKWEKNGKFKKRKAWVTKNFTHWEISKKRELWIPIFSDWKVSKKAKVAPRSLGWELFTSQGIGIGRYHQNKSKTKQNLILGVNRKYSLKKSQQKDFRKNTTLLQNMGRKN